MCKFIYSFLIAMQLLFLAVTEVKRLKKMFAFMVNNAKIIRIKSNQYNADLPSVLARAPSMPRMSHIKVDSPFLGREEEKANQE